MDSTSTLPSHGSRFRAWSLPLALVAVTFLPAVVLAQAPAARHPRPMAPPSDAFTPPTSGPDPCLEHGTIYAVDSGSGLWKIDATLHHAARIGSMSANMFDVAITSEGKIFGITGYGDVYRISACTAATTYVRGISSFNNGMVGDLSATTDLFLQGPPLLRMKTWGTRPVTTVGGSQGSGPPAWCGASSGDLAVNPQDGLVYSTLYGCGRCGGADLLVVVDPATGYVLWEVGCLMGDRGTSYSSVYGLAFDRSGRLWGGIGYGSMLILINPATGASTGVTISGGIPGIYGLASWGPIVGDP